MKICEHMGLEGRKRDTPLFRVKGKERDSSWESWEWQLKNRINTAGASPLYPFFSQRDQERCRKAEERFSVQVTPYYYSLIDWSNPRDPVAAQAFPVPKEGDPERRGEEDPLGEREWMPVKNLIHKYRDRIVLLVSNQCAVHCRHCNRRVFLRENPPLERDDFREMLKYVASRREVRDVILSGGDPFMLNNPVLEFLLEGLKNISHVEMIRLGTRIPVVLPQRVDSQLSGLLSRYRRLWVNTQFNHPAEITPPAAEAVRRLILAGIPVNNQAVLLRGINDDPGILRDLSLGLLRISVRPYYLFQCDPVDGACHFEVPERKGIGLVDGLKENISGLGLPFYVKDTKGRGKILLAPRSDEGFFSPSLLNLSRKTPADPL